MRVKHWHEWRLYCTYNGGGTDGMVRICEHCGAKKKFGVNGDRLVKEYKRKGEPWRS